MSLAAGTAGDSRFHHYPAARGRQRAGILSGRTGVCTIPVAQRQTRASGAAIGQGMDGGDSRREPCFAHPSFAMASPSLDPRNRSGWILWLSGKSGPPFPTPREPHERTAGGNPLMEGLGCHASCRENLGFRRFSTRRQANRQGRIVDPGNGCRHPCDRSSRMAGRSRAAEGNHGKLESLTQGPECSHEDPVNVHFFRNLPDFVGFHAREPQIL